MSWALLVLLGATINALLNFSYKRLAGRVNLQIFIASYYVVAALVLGLYAYYTDPAHLAILLDGKTQLVILCMSIGTSLVFTMLLTALLRGPISLVDPMWACIYALCSVAIGMIGAHEHPGIYALAGVALYLAGVVLMALGSRPQKQPE